MANGLVETLLELLSDPGAAAAQADLAQAAALGRQELSFRQRAAAAAFQLRQAKADGADDQEIAELEAELKKRNARLEAATAQAAAADLKRPLPDPKQAQVFGRAQGTVEKPPVTAAVLTASGQVAASVAAAANGTFHIAVEGDLTDVTLQLSDAAGRVLYRASQPVSIAAGTVLYLDVSLREPKQGPGPVPTEMRMPNLVGQSESVARALLRRMGVTNVEIVDQVADGEPGIVLAQVPRPTTVLQSDIKVSLLVRRASGERPAPAFLPGFIGRPRAEAEAKLREVGLPVTVKRQPDSGPPDIVLDQSPAEGTPLKQVRTVGLVVSEPREAPPETVVVPDVVGKSRDLALELLKATDLGAEVKDTADAGVPAGVTKQDPAAGTTVKRKSVVQITVNTPPVVQPNLVAVPTVTGGTSAEARRRLLALGLDIQVKSVPSTEPKGRVIAQDPAANARVRAGTVVTVPVSTGAAPTAASPGEHTALIRAMADDPRAEEAGLTTDRITTLFVTGEITEIDAARTLANAAPREIRTRLQLRTVAEATRFRAILAKAIRALD
jgi:beta-lactam-binding protein with PASTA domain